VLPGVEMDAIHTRAQKQYEGLIATFPERSFQHPPVEEIFLPSFPVVQKPA
jgi:hypothetical protein